MTKRLYRSNTNRMIAGICGGIADYFEVDPTIIRLAAVVLLLVTVGLAVVLYLISIIIIPNEPAGPVQ